MSRRRSTRRQAWVESVPGAPPPICVTVLRRVRFEEVDSLGVVWHGHYPSYFEDARVVLGRKYGIGYDAFYTNRTPSPIRELHFDYKLPLKFEEEVSIEAILHWSEAASLTHEYVIRKADGRVATTGYSIQLMLDEDFELLIVAPPFFQDFCRRWKAGELGG